MSGARGLRPVGASVREALYSIEATRHIEREAIARQPVHTLMARAGLSVAHLALALRPHSGIIWVACGPGNNGGDGLVAATHLHRWAQARGGMPRVVVTHWTGDPDDDSRLPADARNALTSARQAGVEFADQPPACFDLAIDAVLGLGATRPAQGRLSDWLLVLRSTVQPVLSVDLPSGLDADTGVLSPLSGTPPPTLPGPRHTLSLLTLKPGLFTAHGRDAAGRIWMDDLGVVPPAETPVLAWLAGQEAPAVPKVDGLHASHKGSFGDVVVIGGQGICVDGSGMTGAALLAARAALQAGAGRVFVGLLQGAGADGPTWDPVAPELMFRRPERLLEEAMLRQGCVVCGCGGGVSVVSVLPRVLSGVRCLVLDADALNAIAADTNLQTQLRHRQGRGWTTVITPHPLEAARLLACDTAAVMADRLKAAQALAEGFGVVCVLKGSGTVLGRTGRSALDQPHRQCGPWPRAGTGDVLAGMLGSVLARPGKGRRLNNGLAPRGSGGVSAWVAGRTSGQKHPA